MGEVEEVIVGFFKVIGYGLVFEFLFVEEGFVVCFDFGGVVGVDYVVVVFV